MKGRLPRYATAVGVAMVMLTAVASCGNGGGATDTATVVSDFTQEATVWVDSVMGAMTIEEMVGQTLMPAIYTVDDEETRRQLRRYVSDYSVCGVVLLKGDTVSCRSLADEMQQLSPVPMFVAMDAEWGLGMRLQNAPVFPVNSTIGSHATEEALYDYGYEMARECRQIGVNMVLGPVLDVVDDPEKGGVIGHRSFGGDAAMVATLGVAYARGLEDGNVVSVAKHFPGHGSVTGDTHKSLQKIDKSREEMEKTDLRPFRCYASSGLSAIMTGHLYAPALDSVERPASVSEAVISGLLRDEMGFSGLVITDALNMGGANGFSAVEALTAGADIVICPIDTGEAFRAIAAAVSDGTLPVSALREKCRRILLGKYRIMAGEGERMRVGKEALETPATRRVTKVLNGSR